MEFYRGSTGQVIFFFLLNRSFFPRIGVTRWHRACHTMYCIGKNRLFFLFRLAKARVNRGSERPCYRSDPVTSPPSRAFFNHFRSSDVGEASSRGGGEEAEGMEPSSRKISYRLIARVLCNCNFSACCEQKRRNCVVSTVDNGRFYSSFPLRSLSFFFS